MTFDDEWAQLKADAQDRRSTQMSLNTAGPESGSAASGANSDLVVHQDDLGAVGNEAFRVHGELQKRADIAGAGIDKAGAGTTARARPSCRDGTSARAVSCTPLSRSGPRR